MPAYEVESREHAKMYLDQLSNPFLRDNVIFKYWIEDLLSRISILEDKIKQLEVKDAPKKKAKKTKKAK